MRRAILLVAATFWCAFPPVRSFACTCADLGAQTLLTQADLVFAGEAIRAEIVDGGGVTVASKSGQSAVAPAQVVTFRVHAVWKGDVAKEIRVWTKVGPVGICGVDFRIGDKYLVFGLRDAGKGRWESRTELCFGTGYVRDKATRSHLQELGSPSKMFPVAAWWGDILERR